MLEAKTLLHSTILQTSPQPKKREQEACALVKLKKSPPTHPVTDQYHERWRGGGGLGSHKALETHSQHAMARHYKTPGSHGIGTQTATTWAAVPDHTGVVGNLW